MELKRKCGRRPRDKYRKISVTFDVDLYKELELEARRLKTSRSNVLERMLKRYLFQEDKNGDEAADIKLRLIRYVAKEDYISDDERCSLNALLARLKGSFEIKEDDNELE